MDNDLDNIRLEVERPVRKQITIIQERDYDLNEATVSWMQKL